MVVLARVIVDRDQVELTADGVQSLVNILRSSDDKALILGASLISSLSHTRAGIPDAITTVGAIDLLMDKLGSKNDQVGATFAETPTLSEPNVDSMSQKSVF